MLNFDGTEPLRRGRVIGGFSDPAGFGISVAGTIHPIQNQGARKNTRQTDYTE